MYVSKRPNYGTTNNSARKLLKRMKVNHTTKQQKSNAEKLAIEEQHAILLMPVWKTDQRHKNDILKIHFQ